MKILFILSFIFSFNALAGDKVRNGGDYVKCMGNFAFFYDYYDLLKNKKVSVLFPKVGSDPYEIAQAIIDRQPEQDRLFKELMTRYLQYMKRVVVFSDVNYQKQVSFIDREIDAGNNPLPDINDNPNLELGRGCRIGQAAASGFENGFWTCEIFEPAWELMSYENRATLVLHEIIYRLAELNGHSNSTNVVKLTQAMLIAGKGITSNDQLLKLRKQLNLLVPGE